MSDPIYMLTVAPGLGAAFLTLGSVIAIANRLLSGDQAGALFGPRRAVLLILYLSLLGGLITLPRAMGFPAATLAIVATLILLTGYQWQSSDTPYGERIFTTLIETFEIVNALHSQFAVVPSRGGLQPNSCGPRWPCSRRQHGHDWALGDAGTGATCSSSSSKASS